MDNIWKNKLELQMQEIWIRPKEALRKRVVIWTDFAEGYGVSFSRDI